MLASRDSDGPQHGGRLNFSLRSDDTVRLNWKLTPINGEEKTVQMSAVSQLLTFDEKGHLKKKKKLCACFRIYLKLFST